MKTIVVPVFLLSFIYFSVACKQKSNQAPKDQTLTQSDSNDIVVDRFADIQVLRYEIPGFENLSQSQKKLAYYLYEAALSGRDIIYDQGYKHNLLVRKTIETIWSTFAGDKTSEDWKKFETYAKRVWFSNGIHHHYASDKFIPEFSFNYFEKLVKNSKGDFPLQNGQTKDQLISFLQPIIFDPTIDAKSVNLDADVDNIKASANNFYEGLTQKEVEEYYSKRIPKNDLTPVEHGLNSKLVKENGKIVEKTWKVGGMYSAAIERIVYWLEKAITVAETPDRKNRSSFL